MNITITGQVHAKKNSRDIFVKNGRIVNIPNKRYKEWEASAIDQLVTYRGCADGPVMVLCEFYHQDKRKRDIDNEMSSVLDMLVKKGLLSSDDCFVVQETHAVFGGIDKDNPRVEITIEEL